MEAFVASATWTTEQFDAIQAHAAETAQTVGSFRENVHSAAMDLLQEGGDVGVVTTRLNVMQQATKDQADLCMASTDAGVLGHNTIGGGREGAVLSAEMFASMSTIDDAEQAQHTAEHEARHGKQAHLNGDVVFHNSVVDTLTLYEGDAELAANAAVGLPASEHREGQPAELYREGQAVVYALQQAVGEALVTRVLTETGDVTELQAALDERGIGRSAHGGE